MALLVAGDSEAARINAIAVLDFTGSFPIIGIVDVAQDGE